MFYLTSCVSSIFIDRRPSTKRYVTLSPRWSKHHRSFVIDSGTLQAVQYSFRQQRTSGLYVPDELVLPVQRYSRPCVAISDSLKASIGVLRYQSRAINSVY